jgi:hypothetical protein
MSFGIDALKLLLSLSTISKKIQGFKVGYKKIEEAYLFGELNYLVVVYNSTSNDGPTLSIEYFEVNFSTDHKMVRRGFVGSYPSTDLV